MARAMPEAGSGLARNDSIISRADSSVIVSANSDSVTPGEITVVRMVSPSPGVGPL